MQASSTQTDRIGIAGSAAIRPRTAGRRPINRQEHQRQHEIEMLLDRQAPRMAAGRAEIILDVEQVREQIPGVGTPCVGQQAQRGEDGQVQVIGRPDLEAAADQEPADVQPAPRPQFMEEEPAHEETAQDEEEVDSRPAEPMPRPRDSVQRTGLFGREDRMPAQDQEDRDPPEDVELDQARVRSWGPSLFPSEGAYPGVATPPYPSGAAARQGRAGDYNPRGCMCQERSLSAENRVA